MNQLNGQRSVLITGASSGIGKACALHFAKMGLHVFAGIRKDSDAMALKKEVTGKLTPLFLDVTDSDSIAAARKIVFASVGTNELTGIINNAGVPLGGPLEFINLDDFREQIEINLIGAIAVTQAFLPLLRRSKGRIINISSVSGLIALPFDGPYAATKFALEAISDALRVELRPWRISVSIIEPSRVDTPIWEK